MFDLHLIRRGMRVVDATGDEVGQVDDIKMGDPAATTAKGQSQEYESFTDLLARTVSAGGELPTERRERLLRLGYVKVNAPRRRGEGFYVPADQVDHVEADVVYLGIARPL